MEYKNAVVQRKDEIIELTKLFWDKSFYNKVKGKRRSMGIYLNPGNDGFKESYICVSRPRRFGKSMAIEMLAAY